MLAQIFEHRGRRRDPGGLMDRAVQEESDAIAIVPPSLPLRMVAPVQNRLEDLGLQGGVRTEAEGRGRAGP
jgi:hypothetical protein